MHRSCTCPCTHTRAHALDRVALTGSHTCTSPNIMTVCAQRSPRRDTLRIQRAFAVRHAAHHLSHLLNAMQVDQRRMVDARRRVRRVHGPPTPRVRDDGANEKHVVRPPHLKALCCAQTSPAHQCSCLQRVDVCSSRGALHGCLRASSSDQSRYVRTLHIPSHEHSHIPFHTFIYAC